MNCPSLLLAQLSKHIITNHSKMCSFISIFSTIPSNKHHPLIDIPNLLTNQMLKRFPITLLLLPFILAETQDNSWVVLLIPLATVIVPLITCCIIVTIIIIVVGCIMSQVLKQRRTQVPPQQVVVTTSQPVQQPVPQQTVVPGYAVQQNPVYHQQPVVNPQQGYVQQPMNQVVQQPIIQQPVVNQYGMQPQQQVVQYLQNVEQYDPKKHDMDMNQSAYPDLKVDLNVNLPNTQQFQNFNL